MKKLLLILLCLPMIGFGQSVPQGINYQAVARDANGDVLMNQVLIIQFSVISDITTGSVSWQETHYDTTNAYGLFTAVIGQGTSTSSGSSANFDVIDWGSSNHLLKVEIDYGGGLVDMGTTSFMSVPYALHAKSSSVIDSTMFANMIFNYGGGMGGGCDFRFPDGISGEPLIIDLSNVSNYQVPMGKRLYILNLFGGNSSLYIDGIFAASNNVYYSTLSNPLILNEGQNVTGSFDPRFNGFLANANDSLQAVTVDLSNVSNYQVPMGKRLYILNLFGGNSSLYIDGIFAASNNVYYSTLSNPLIVNEGQNVTGSFDPRFNGFLVNKDFFNDCSKESNFGNYAKDTLSYFNNQTRFVESMNDEFLLITDLQTCSLLNPFVQIFNDTISIQPLFQMNIGTSSITVPIKKGQFWKLVNVCQHSFDVGRISSN